jgi:arylsulfatase A-like enzyme
MYTLPLLLAALTVAADSTTIRGMPDTSKMNILFIDIEDTNPDAIGCYGNPIPKTPHLDRFATTGVRFHSAYCQAICCNPTRTSFLTGLRPLSTRVLSNGHNMNQHLPPEVLSLPEMLKTRGIYTAVIGKLFHQLDYAERQLATFDRIEMYSKPQGWKGPEPILEFPALPKTAERDPAPKDRNSKEYRQWRARHSDRYGDSGLTREQEHDYRMAQTAVALLKEFAKTKRQFFLALAQSRPHTPLIAPKQYIDMYDPVKIPDPPAAPTSLKGFPYAQRAAGGNPDIFMQKQPTAQQAQEAIAAYYACMSFVDDNIGMVLDALEREGLDKNTIVVFLGDHGFHLGDHGCWSKYSMLEATRRVALIMRVPGAPANGKVCREFVEFVDLVPTLGELVKLNLPSNLEGTSFAPLLINPDQPWKKAVFMVDGDGGQVARTRKYSYLELKKGPVLTALYDLEKDPWETINVAEDPAYATARREMGNLLRAGWRAALPPVQSAAAR